LAGFGGQDDHWQNARIVTPRQQDRSSPMSNTSPAQQGGSNTPAPQQGQSGGAPSQQQGSQPPVFRDWAAI
jgi:hypothetical protein